MTDREQKLVEACARLNGQCVHEWINIIKAEDGEDEWRDYPADEWRCTKCNKYCVLENMPPTTDNPIDLGSVDAALAFAERHEVTMIINIGLFNVVVTTSVGKVARIIKIIKWFKDYPNRQIAGAIAIIRAVLAAKGVEV